MQPRTVTVTTPARNRRLATVAALKAELGITGSAEDARLGTLLDRASGRLAGPEFFGFLPLRQSYAVAMAGSGRMRLYPGVYPVETVATLTRDGATIEASEYAVAGALREYLLRETGWPHDARVWADVTEEGRPGTAAAEYALALTAGWLPPELVDDWTAAAAKTAGYFARATDPTLTLRFEVTTAGTTGATEPTWPDAAGETVADGTVVWTARAALELPEGLQEAALLLAAERYHRGPRDPAVAAMKSGEKSISYHPGGVAPGYLRPLLAGYVL